jgi:predicted dehydrogenase
VIQASPRAEIAGVIDIDAARAASTGYKVFQDIEDLRGQVDAAIIATPTTTHSEIGCRVLALGIDVLVEKPVAHDLNSAQAVIDTARDYGRILQVGHLERFNPAVLALEKTITKPLFFEVHRMSEFSPRSLDVDVVLDLMIHDLDIVLALTRAELQEVRAAGISILSPKVDIANVRLAFTNGCIANLTASRVSTERVRKLRLFQPHQYISLDYQRQDAVAFSVTPPASISFQPLPVSKDEPLRLELEAFLDCVETRGQPRCSGEEAARSLKVALQILDKIEEHAQLVADTLAAPGAATAGNPAAS